MTKIKVSDATGPVLDWMVWVCAGGAAAYPKTASGKAFLKLWQGNSAKYVHPSTDWAQGGPIIERELLDVCSYEPSGKGWRCTKREPNYTKAPDRYHSAEWGPTPLVAAMRCFVASKLGDEVDVPEELLS